MSVRTEIDSAIKLVTWIKRKLGWPTIQLEIDDTAILDNINDAIQWFQRYSGGVTYQNALIIDLAPGINTYTLNENVASIIDFDTSYSFGGSITQLFTVENILYNEGLLAGHAPMEMVTWELAQEYIEMMKDKLAARFFVNYNKYTRELKLTPTPTKTLTGILTVYSYWEHNVKTTIFDELVIKNLSLALTKIVLGTIWSKYSGIPLPGGGMLNGDAIKAEGISERDYWMNEIINYESEPLGFILG